MNWYWDVKKTRMRFHSKTAYKYAFVNQLQDRSTSCLSCSCQPSSVGRRPNLKGKQANPWGFVLL